MDFRRRIEKSMLSILVWLWIISSSVAAKKQPYVPAMFVLGDSLADAGNNNYIPHCEVRANYTPYGVSFFPSPTGRFTNGRTAFDFITTYLGLPYLPPYLQPKADFMRGINFASGGSGLLVSTGARLNIISLSHQVEEFEHFSHMLTRTNPSGPAQAKSYLGKSLYCITIGGNDIGDYIANTTLQNTTTPQRFVRMLLANFDQYITRLYNSDARKFLVFDIPALGCAPNIRFAGYSLAKGACLNLANQLAVAYNTAFKTLVAHLNQKLDGVSIIQLNTYNYFMDIMQNAKAYGFKYTTIACCGSGMFNVQVSCGKTKPQTMFCNNTSEYVFWDGIHPTEKVNAMFSHQIWSGNSSVMYPSNLSTLILGKNSSGH
ncbi:GDSL esterase/lipase 7 [Cryptomeria japonica]|uniref:GDSL esterase/lipase 7 n=1 Tax=Cryptomeria japonica TaxID=3369 RepID=UPI0027DA6E11|nr:GDSL esterase/lipase 7 [Cryptomeria japonica]